MNDDQSTSYFSDLTQFPNIFNAETPNCYDLMTPHMLSTFESPEFPFIASFDDTASSAAVVINDNNGTPFIMKTHSSNANSHSFILESEHHGDAQQYNPFGSSHSSAMGHYGSEPRDFSDFTDNCLISRSTDDSNIDVYPSHSSLMTAYDELSESAQPQIPSFFKSVFYDDDEAENEENQRIITPWMHMQFDDYANDNKPQQRIQKQQNDDDDDIDIQYDNKHQKRYKLCSKTRKRLDTATVQTDDKNKSSEAPKTCRKKRKREETIDNNGSEMKPKKQRLDEDDIYRYILETMTRKEANGVFRSLVDDGEVIMNDDGFWCFVDECNKKFGTKCHLKRHVEEKHIGRAFRCVYNECEYDENGGTFKQRTQCKEHIKNIHLKDESEWRCYLCGERFTRWNGARRHLVLKRCKLMKDDMSATQIQNIVNLARGGNCRAWCRR